MNVVWLASWFPNRTNTTTGDFIERHAKAVAPYVQQLSIIAVVKDESMAAGTQQIITTVNGNCTTYIAYYGKGKWGKLFEKIYSVKKYIYLQQTVFNIIKKKCGLPNIVHVHVAMKAGLFAVKIKKKYGIKYLLTEHWTGYYHTAIPNLHTMGLYFRQATKRVFKHAALFLPVTKHLANTVSNAVYTLPYLVVPNVVDTSIFKYAPLPQQVFTFIHVSYLNDQKNIEGMLQACSIVAAKGICFKLNLVGSLNKTVIQNATALKLLNKYVFVQDAVPYTQVPSLMQASNALLMFSKFENLPCVILEALCCGLPVITTKVGGIDEVINESNGIFVPSKNVAALAVAMEQMIKNEVNFNTSTIANKASSMFNYKIIGQSIYQQYQLLR